MFKVVSSVSVVWREGESERERKEERGIERERDRGRERAIFKLPSMKNCEKKESELLLKRQTSSRGTIRFILPTAFGQPN